MPPRARNSEDMTLQPPTPFPGRLPEPVAFHRTELGPILSVYGRMVAAGEWRDYAISSLRDMAVFSVFRRTAETPLYRIEKRPKLRQRQGQFAVFGPEGQVLRRGDDLAQVLKVFDARRFKVIE